MNRAGDDLLARAAGRLLGWVVRVLPAGRQEWGRAMQAELARVEPGSARRKFAGSGVRLTRSNH